jgi:hypothetical protein
MLLVVGGLSGAGKSALGRHLEGHYPFRWVELDCYPKDMVDELAIRPEWEDFLVGNPSRLIEHFAGDVVLTVPSRLIIDASKYLSSDEVRVRYLTGSPDVCFSRASARSPALVDRRHWDANNNELVAYLASAACPLDWKVQVFDRDGSAQSLNKIAQAVLADWKGR